MIFKQIEALLSGAKTQTRRAKKEHEYAYSQYGSDEITEVYTSTDERIRTKWRVGNTYAVTPKGGLPAVQVYTSSEFRLQHPSVVTDVPAFIRDRMSVYCEMSDNEWLEAEGYTPLRIRITAIRQERLGNITEADAIAEGVESVEAYKALWTSINGHWDGEVAVWVISFEVQS